MGHEHPAARPAEVAARRAGTEELTLRLAVVTGVPAWGSGQTLIAGDGGPVRDHPTLRLPPFEPRLVHDVVLLWTADSETSAVRDLAAGLRR